MRKPVAWLACAMMAVPPLNAVAKDRNPGSMVAGEPACRVQCAVDDLTAHLQASRRYLAAALNERREYAWHVYRMPDGTYSYSYPEKGRVGSTSGRTPPAHGRHPVSSGHVHWDGQDRFSGLDWLWVRGNQRPLYLANADGELRVLGVNQVRLLRRNGRRASHVPDSTYPGRLLAANLLLPRDDRRLLTSHEKPGR